MFLGSVEFWDFRKYKSYDNSPGLTVKLQNGMNLIVGENDAGKTAIIDGIKLLLGTLSDDYDKIIDTDFYNEDGKIFSEEFKIVGLFYDLSDKEAAKFLEWISFDDDSNSQLKLTLKVVKKKNPNGNEYFDRKIYGGDHHSETVIDSEARQILKAVYLKPLRDAQRELSPGPYSRLSKILSAHPKIGEEEKNELLSIIDNANNKVKSFFSNDEHNVVKSIIDQLETLYDKSDSEKSKVAFNVSEANIYSILSRLSLDTESVNLGLGNSNLLYIAVELLLMHDSDLYIGPRIALIEEIEAHLHTQAQIRLIKQMENNNGTQFILTSHSTNLASSINPKNLILIHNNQAFSMSQSDTLLDAEDYEFLERFLDATKSNLFFAKGLIFVEGDAENLLLPAFAELIGYPLHEYGISIVNIGNTAFERYVKLFSRSGDDRINLPISVVTDVDVRPMEFYVDKKESLEIYVIENQDQYYEILEESGELIELDEEELPFGQIFSTFKKLKNDFGLENVPNEEELKNKVSQKLNKKYFDKLTQEKKNSITQKYAPYNANKKIFVAPEWTLEYSLSKSPLAELLWKSIHETRYKNPINISNMSKFEMINDQIINNRDSISSQLAYDIFKPVNDKIVSKAIVSQKLAIEIGKLDNTEKEELKAKVLSSSYTQYLVNAIKYAAQITDDDEVVIDA
ncbi:AAA family ATPase [Streptococcus parasuis]|uniref:ATP-dependent nuclease n=1 Tax=Streptococcus parasuis TaxID=1501662 RepID=UPI00289BD5CB|nr:AAA family ATPase [Streptococcus parasuis]